MAVFDFIDSGWWLGNCGFHCVAAFFLTLLLQMTRARVSGKWYRISWVVLAVVAIVWGGLALVEYLPHILIWHRVILLLPWLLFAVGLAKAKDWMSLGSYLGMLFAVLILLAMFFYATDGLMLEFNLSRWLRGLGPIDRGGGRGDPAGGFAMALGSEGSGFPSLHWYFYKSPGLVLLACTLAVPPRFSRRNAATGTLNAGQNTS